MSESLTDTGNLWANLFLIGSGIGGGTLAVAFLEWFLNKKIKDKEEYIKISEAKVKILEKLLPDYIDLISFHSSLARLIRNSVKEGTIYGLDNVRCLYYICKIFSLLDNIGKKGGIQLHNYKAEKLVSKFGEYLFDLIEKRATYVDIHVLTKLGKSDSNFKSESCNYS